MPSKNVEETIWQDKAISSIVDFAKASDGDFEAINKLANALSDEYSSQKMVEFLSEQPQGKSTFKERPYLGVIDLQKLHCLPKNTLGYCYANHLLENNLKPLQFSGELIETDAQYLGAHITESHDIWHVITGCQTDILGEIQLEAFSVAQLYASRFWLGLITKNLLKATVYDIEVSGQYMDAIAKGWLMGKETKPLFGIRWNELWEKPLQKVRDNLKI